MSDNIIGNNLKKIRQDQGLTLSKFGELLETSYSYLSEIENGKKALSLNLIMSLSAKCEVNVNWLLTGEGQMYRQEKERPSNGIVNIADIPREHIKQWIDDFWKDLDEEKRVWLIVEMKRQFPEFALWLEKNEESLSEQNTSPDSVTNRA
ncbi:MAG: helix-turn-helix transcriptional regulator [Thermodesulfobacteriota bacterium]|nr:helix-turn-helix transcriptional regulator [Thermodesulfobacteriota bacterium]